MYLIAHVHAHAACVVCMCMTSHVSLLISALEPKTSGHREVVEDVSEGGKGQREWKGGGGREGGTGERERD